METGYALELSDTKHNFTLSFSIRELSSARLVGETFSKGRNMSKEVLILVDAIAREKNVEREIVFESLESALASATKKRFPHDSDIVVRIDRSNGEYDAFRRWKVVEDDEFTNDESEITLIGARKQIDDIEIGDYIEEELKAEKFGRIGRKRPNKLLPKKFGKLNETSSK